MRITTCPTALILFGIFTIWQMPAAAECPAVGADTTCGLVITITNTGAAVSSTGQPPYDNIEDTLIGVVNNSGLPITSIDLKSGISIFGFSLFGTPIFSFDGDGIDTYGIPGNSFDATGYGGPNSYFTNISADQTAGRVNFLAPIATNGGTGYFSLEYALSSATPCTSVLNNSMTGPNLGNSGTEITASFTPQNGYSLADAAQLCGFTTFDWQQTIKLLPLPSPFYAVGSNIALSAPPPFNDPPPGGYQYCVPAFGYPCDDYPFYYGVNYTSENPFSLVDHISGNTLSFFDAPQDPCLPGGNGCGGKTAPAGSYIAFTTHLVGVLANGSAQDTGIGFSWTDTFNGGSGQISTLNLNHVDPSTGTGGITVTGVSETSTLSSVGITAVNGGPVGGGNQSLPSGDACNGVFSGTFNGNVSVSPGQNCSFINASINGNVNVNGGNFSLSGTWIAGNLEINGAPTLSIEAFSAISGNVEIHNLPSGVAIDEVCNSIVYGNLHVHNNASPVDIGSSNSSVCGGNVIGSNLQVGSNSGATEIFNNKITDALLCENNSAIQGGLNSAARKNGQCTAF